jgi:hypothetical protein
MQPIIFLKYLISGDYILFISCFNRRKFTSLYQKPVLLFFKITVVCQVDAVI